MENYIGTLCPYCNAEIKEGDAVKVCPSCQTAHHEQCWTQHQGCSTAGCEMQPGQKEEVQPKAETDELVCKQCKSVLSPGQKFCQKCGARVDAQDVKVCSRCGAELKAEQKFCSACGMKVDETASVVSTGNTAAPVANAVLSQQPMKDKKNTALIIGLIAGAVVVIALILLFVFGGGTKDFNEMYGDMAEESWCIISEDGTYMRIDTNPYDIDEYFISDAYYKLEEINEDLGFSAALFEEMGETRALDGRQSEENDKYSVSWRYHPNSGLEVTYEIKP